MEAISPKLFYLVDTSSSKSEMVSFKVIFNILRLEAIRLGSLALGASIGITFSKIDVATINCRINEKSEGDFVPITLSINKSDPNIGIKVKDISIETAKNTRNYSSTFNVPKIHEAISNSEHIQWEITSPPPMLYPLHGTFSFWVIPAQKDSHKKSSNMELQVSTSVANPISLGPLSNTRDGSVIEAIMLFVLSKQFNCDLKERQEIIRVVETKGD